MPRKRRGRNENGAGTVSRRSDGRWEGKLSYRGEDGRLRRLTVYGKTAEEARAKLTAKKHDQLRGVLVTPERVTVGEWAEAWMAARRTEGRAANTLRNYQTELNLAMPMLGNLPMQRVKPEHIRGVVVALSEQGRAPRTVKKVLERLSALFEDAVRLERLHRNPCHAVTYKRPPSEPVGRSMQPEEVARLLEVCDRHRIGLLFRLILATGLRKAEALALTWADVDFLRAELHVSKAWTKVGGIGVLTGTKSRRSKRVLPVPSGLLTRLRERKAEMLAFAQGEPGWAEAVERSYIFAELGRDKPYSPDTPNHHLKELLDEAALPHYRVHDLRHTYGSLMLSRGLPVEVVSERMGHASITITLNVYRHVLEHERKGHVLDLEDILRPQPRHSA
ncbi:tyrosine-type recombinase/integrase [Meiothermus granaticius]|uniref:Putative defective protein IntQ n=1 Tax=Meiothermus granaticius NBRC 107808 TaxID=1227551 RepID=A0A399FBQ1_9DEIN|nr:tyrosine-type recombinase/integrase [Meiothermus granaticius]RIH94027.1 putative defective protein IntQ [Meiothermus granaticius NBRC 107808]GEM88144.1 site-specific integrase [Meiothermus granaticius NBRC 107808]